MIFGVRNLTFDRVNLLMNDLTAGMPSPLGFLGLASAIAPSLGCERWAPSVLPILHSVTPSQGRTKAELSLKNGMFSPQEIFEDLIGTARVSMLIDLPGCEDAGTLGEALTGARLAGGSLRSHAPIKPFSVKADGSCFSKFPRGYAVLPFETASHHLVSGGKERISMLFDALNPGKDGSGWRVPIPAGYRLIEDPETVNKRSGTRSDTIPHVFAEPLASIGELVSVRNRQRMTGINQETLSSMMWSWTTSDDLILGHKAFITS